MLPGIICVNHFDACCCHNPRLDPDMPSETLLRRRDVELRVGMRKSTIYAHMADGTFPLPVRRGASVFWVESEIDQWIDDRIAERDNAH